MNSRFRNVLIVASLIGWANAAHLAPAQEVAVEVRIVKVSDAVMEQLGLDGCMTEQSSGCPSCPACKSSPACPTSTTKVVMMNEAQVRQFLQTAQGDPRTNVMQAPKLTIDNGQNSSLEITDQHYYVTHFDLVQVGGQVVFVPKNEPVTTGMQMTLQPAVSADRRTVQLTLHAKLSDLDTVVPLFPVTTMITPVSEDGAKGQPVPFTQYVQQPHVSTIQIDNAVTVADGGTALLGGWKSTKVMRNESGPPTLSKIPYVNRLFKNVGYGRESENVILLVTPRIIMHQEEEIRIASGVVQTSAAALAQPTSKETACPIADKGCCELARLLDLYHRACSEGRLADASQFAVQALALDPRCFAKCAKECANGK